MYCEEGERKSRMVGDGERSIKGSNDTQDGPDCSRNPGPSGSYGSERTRD